MNKATRLLIDLSLNGSEQEQARARNELRTLMATSVVTTPDDADRILKDALFACLQVGGVDRTYGGVLTAGNRHAWIRFTTVDADQNPVGRRERFEKWVMAKKHPVLGFLDGHWLTRGDDREGYANEYVQGLWVAFKEFADPLAPVLPDHSGDTANMVALTAVATLVDDGDGGLEPSWLLEGGTAELLEGMMLLVADTDQTLCAEDGSAELYRAPVASPTQSLLAILATAQNTLASARWLIERYIPKHNWLPHITRDLEAIKAALVKEKQ